MRKGAKRTKKGIFLIVAVFLAAVSAFAAVKLVQELRQSKKEADKFAELAAMKLPREEAAGRESTDIVIVPKSTPRKTVVVDDRELDMYVLPKEGDTEKPEKPARENTIEEEPCDPTPLPQYQALYDRNHDFFGWLSIPGTTVDYPVMHSPDRPQQYLEHDFDGNFAYAGVPFMDGDCKRDGNLYLIYGHRMRNGSIFGGLVVYMDKSFWEKQPMINFDTVYEERTYVVIVAMRAKVLESGDRDGFRYYNYTSLDTESDFDEYMRQAKKLAMYDTGMTASYGDELLVLSTCDNYTQEGRFVVIAKRVS